MPIELSQIIQMTYQCNLGAYLMQTDFEVSIQNDVDLYNSDGKLFFPMPFLTTLDDGKCFVVYTPFFILLYYMF